MFILLYDVALFLDYMLSKKRGLEELSRTG